MKGPLMEMGMKDAFRKGDANFQGINGANDLWLSEFSQLNQLVVGGQVAPLPPRARRFFRGPPGGRHKRQSSSAKYKLCSENPGSYTYLQR